MKRQHVVRCLLVVAAVLAVDQTVQHTVLRDGRFVGQWVIPFDPPLFTDVQKHRARDLAAILAGDEELRATSLFDPELGWCPRPGQVMDVYVHDWSGSRIGTGELPREKPPGVRRALALGGSFTQGAEVAGPRSWSALVDAEHPELQVANLGVAGYGVDQALLRYLRDGRPLDADEVWLGFMPNGTLRITTQFPPVFRHWSSVVAFKPRYLLDGAGELTLVPSPAADFRAFQRLLEDQEAFLAALGETDRWVRRAPVAFAPRGSSWSHHFATSRLYYTWREGGGRDPEPLLQDPTSDVYLLLRALVVAFAREAEAAGASFRLLLLPSRTDLEHAREDPANPYWRSLLDDLRARGIECIDTTPNLLQAGADTDPGYWMPFHHYSPRANRVVAEAFERALYP